MIKEEIFQVSNNALIVDYVESYPTGLVSIFKEHQNEFDSIRHLIINKEFWYDNSPVYEYYNNSPLYQEIHQFLSKGNYAICLFHVSRLLTFEIESIITHGFQKTSNQMLLSKIKIAHKFGYFTDEEAVHLSNHLLNHTQNPLSQVYAYTSLSFLIEDSKSKMKINSWWGGESISWHYDERNCTKSEEKIIEKLKSIGNPSVIVIAQNYNNLYSLTHDGEYISATYNIVNLIILIYLSNLYSLKFNTNYFGEVYFDSLPIVKCILPLSYFTISEFR